MSPFFDELEGQLRSAAREVAGGQHAPASVRPRRPRRWLPFHVDLAPVLASVVVVLVVGAALVLLGRGGGHQPTPPAAPPPNAGLAALITHTPQKQLRREFAYMSAATKDVLASKVCQVQQPSGVSFVHRTPDRQLLSLLGVLRRPATPADQLNHRVFTGIPDVYAGSIRRAVSRDGESYYLAVTGADRAATIPSDRCFALQKHALALYLPHIPPALRAQTMALQAGYIGWGRELFNHGPRDSVCLVDVGLGDNGTSCGTTATEIRDGIAPSYNQGVFVGIVPDGVARVTLVWPARSVTAPVAGNVYAVRVPGAPEPPTEPTVTWRAADGRVLKTIRMPTQAMEREACRQEPVQCALIQDGGLSSSSSSSSSSSTTTQATPAPKH